MSERSTVSFPLQCRYYSVFIICEILADKHLLQCQRLPLELSMGKKLLSKRIERFQFDN